MILKRVPFTLKPTELTSLDGIDSSIRSLDTIVYFNLVSPNISYVLGFFCLSILASICDFLFANLQARCCFSKKDVHFKTDIQGKGKFFWM